MRCNSSFLYFKMNLIFLRFHKLIYKTFRKARLILQFRIGISRTKFKLKGTKAYSCPRFRSSSWKKLTSSRWLSPLTRITPLTLLLPVTTLTNLREIQPKKTMRFTTQRLCLIPMRSNLRPTWRRSWPHF